MLCVFHTCFFFSSADEKEEGILGSILLPSFHISMLSVDDHVNRKYSFKVSACFNSSKSLLDCTFYFRTLKALVLRINCIFLYKQVNSSMCRTPKKYFFFYFNTVNAKKAGQINIISVLAAFSSVVLVHCNSLSWIGNLKLLGNRHILWDRSGVYRIWLWVLHKP